MAGRRTEEFLKQITLEDAQCELSNKVYASCFMYEQLEHLGKVRGNGHHIMQELCEMSTKLLAERWIADVENDTAEDITSSDVDRSVKARNKCQLDNGLVMYYDACSQKGGDAYAHDDRWQWIGNGIIVEVNGEDKVSTKPYSFFKLK